MKDPIESYIKYLLETESTQLKKLNEIVVKSFKEEKLLSNKLRREKIKKVSWADLISDKVAAFGGSWRFILLFITIVVIWVTVNVGIFVIKPFDPYPFILLNLFLSMIAALQAPIILMSQNRQEAKDRKRSEHDYLINLKAELEIRSLHQKIDLMLVEHLKTLLQSQAQQLEILKKLSKDLSTNKKEH